MPSRRSPKGRQRHPELVSTLPTQNYHIASPSESRLRVRVDPNDIALAEQGDKAAQSRVATSYKAALFAARRVTAEVAYSDLTIS